MKEYFLTISISRLPIDVIDTDQIDARAIRDVFLECIGGPTRKKCNVSLLSNNIPMDRRQQMTLARPLLAPQIDNPLAPTRSDAADRFLRLPVRADNEIRQRWFAARVEWKRYLLGIRFKRSCIHDSVCNTPIFKDWNLGWGEPSGA